VRAEFSLTALVYNLRRALNILAVSIVEGPFNALRRFISVQTFGRVRWRVTRSFIWWGSERGSVS
jgi:hypothetical protein